MAKVLVVEDDEPIREMMVWRLTRAGYQVATAADGLEAVDLAGRETPDLVVLDMSLPGIDGWTAARRLREAAVTRETPIIALTAHALAGEREKALMAGCDEYETKPVEFARLVGKIEALLSRQGREA
jgi:two-component system, cell cycle response regulator DivK